MNVKSFLSRTPVSRYLGRKMDRALVRMVASQPTYRLFFAIFAIVALACLSPLIGIAGLIYGALVVFRAVVRKSRRRRSDLGTAVLSRIGGVTHQLVSDDDYLALVEGEFEPEMSSLFKKLIRPGDVAIDIGANIGCTSILFGQLCTKVYSFEPSPSTFRFLDNNLSKAAVANIHAYNVGLGRTSTAETLTFASNNRSGGFVSNQLKIDAGHTTETIQIVRGDDFFSEHQIKEVDFIKIDVEGYEIEVLEGLTAILSINRPVVVLEMNHWCLNAFQRISLPDFIDKLLCYFPVLYAVEGTELVDLRDTDKRYQVTYQHITSMKFQNLIGCFDKSRLSQLVIS